MHSCDRVAAARVRLRVLLCSARILPTVVPAVRGRFPPSQPREVGERPRRHPWHRACPVEPAAVDSASPEDVKLPRAVPAWRRRRTRMSRFPAGRPVVARHHLPSRRPARRSPDRRDERQQAFRRESRRPVPLTLGLVLRRNRPWRLRRLRCCRRVPPHPRRLLRLGRPHHRRRAVSRLRRRRHSCSLCFAVRDFAALRADGTGQLGTRLPAVVATRCLLVAYASGLLHGAAVVARIGSCLGPGLLARLFGSRPPGTPSPHLVRHSCLDFPDCPRPCLSSRSRRSACSPPALPSVGRLGCDSASRWLLSDAVAARCRWAGRARQCRWRRVRWRGQCARGRARTVATASSVATANGSVATANGSVVIAWAATAVGCGSAATAWKAVTASDGDDGIGGDGIGGMSGVAHPPAVTATASNPVAISAEIGRRPTPPCSLCSRAAAFIAGPYQPAPSSRL